MLNQRFGPRIAGHEAASINNIVNPKQVRDVRAAATAVDAWEDLQRRYERCIGEAPQAEPIKVETLFKNLPKGLEEYACNYKD